MIKSTRTRAEAEDLNTIMEASNDEIDGVQTQRKSLKAKESLVLHTWIFMVWYQSYSSYLIITLKA